MALTQFGQKLDLGPCFIQVFIYTCIIHMGSAVSYAYLVSDRCRHTGPSRHREFATRLLPPARREKSAGPLPPAGAVPGPARTPDPLASYTGVKMCRDDKIKCGGTKPFGNPGF